MKERVNMRRVLPYVIVFGTVMLIFSVTWGAWLLTPEQMRKIRGGGGDDYQPVVAVAKVNGGNSTNWLLNTTPWPCFDGTDSYTQYDVPNDLIYKWNMGNGDTVTAAWFSYGGYNSTGVYTATLNVTHAQPDLYPSPPYCDEDSVTVRICAHPTNFRKILEQWQDGNLLLWYAWDSTSGTLADLEGVEIGEIVNYPTTANPYIPPNPPFYASYSNPTVKNFPDETAGVGADTHYAPGFRTPYIEKSYTASQAYRFRCSNCDGEWHTLMANYIKREVKQDGSTWKYVITKHNNSYEMDLP